MKCEYYAKEKSKFVFFPTTHSDKMGISIRWSRIHLCDKAAKNFLFEELKKVFGWIFNRSTCFSFTNYLKMLISTQSQNTYANIVGFGANI